MITNKRKIKLSNIALCLTLALLMAGIFAVNSALKSEYDRLDKNDLYWDFTAILKQPFSHIKINGKGVAKIAFTPGKTASLKVTDSWDKKQLDSILKAHVSNDTLFVDLIRSSSNKNDIEFMNYNVYIRVFAPKLSSVDGSDVNFLIEKLKQDNMTINISGKSKVEVESLRQNFNNINVTQRDSSTVEFKMSPEWKGSKLMSFENVIANLKGHSALNIGNGFAHILKLNIEDGSAIGLSGKSLKQLKN